MTEERQRRVITRTVLSQVIATIVLCIGVGVLTVQTRTGVKKQQVQQTEQLRAGCARGIARDFESYGTNQDLADFAADAAAQKDKDGQHVVATKYRAKEASARARMANIQTRLPVHNDVASITMFCRTLYVTPEDNGPVNFTSTPLVTQTPTPSKTSRGSG